MSTARSADKRIDQAWRRPVCHMFLLFGALWLWTICFYCVTLGHMFLLCGAPPYVSIVWRSAIYFYCVAVGHMFLLCRSKTYVSIFSIKTIWSPLLLNRRLVT